MNPKSEKRSVLITGATGFVGSFLIQRLLKENIHINAAVLNGEDKSHLPGVKQVIVQPLSEVSDYTTALQQVDIVIHLAARVHIMRDTAMDPLQEFRKVNLYGTERLGRQAAQAGVKRFVFMSTIGVNGNSSGRRAFTESDDLSPHNSYSVSKLEAEERLADISSKTGMEVVVLRAPLVYGPGNPGNFLSLLRIVSKGIPLPFESIQNRKSFLYIGNLVDALITCASHPAARGTYLVCDGENISTAELIRKMASALQVPDRLFPMPIFLLKIAGKLTNKNVAVRQIVDSLEVDSSKIKRELSWTPPFTLQQGLQATCDWYLKTYGNQT